MVTESLTYWGSSSKSALQPVGRITVSAPDLRAASTFSLIPPTGRTLPVRDSSPVMARRGLKGRFRAILYDENNNNNGHDTVYLNRLHPKKIADHPPNKQHHREKSISAYLIKDVAMATPAEGPSFSTAPSGTCKCNWWPAKEKIKG